MNRTTFLVDGFNLYHSLKEASRDLSGASTRWLDIRSLLRSYLPLVGGGATLQEIYYFSALALHLDSDRPGHTLKHRSYIDCLQASGVKIELGRFKYKSVYCSTCARRTAHYEEKETDVAISVRLMEVFQADSTDAAVLVTGDTDLAPAVRTATRLFPSKQVCFAFPFKRKNSELAKLVSCHFLMRAQMYAKHQFPDPYHLPSGRSISKPGTW